MEAPNAKIRLVWSFSGTVPPMLLLSRESEEWERGSVRDGAMGRGGGLVRQMLFFLAASCLILQGSPSDPVRPLHRQPPRRSSMGASGSAAGGWRGEKLGQRKFQPQGTPRVPASTEPWSRITWMRGGKAEGVPASDAAGKAGSPCTPLRSRIAMELSEEVWLILHAPQEMYRIGLGTREMPHIHCIHSSHRDPTLATCTHA